MAKKSFLARNIVPIGTFSLAASIIAVRYSQTQQCVLCNGKDPAAVVAGGLIGLGIGYLIYRETR